LQEQVSRAYSSDEEKDDDGSQDESQEEQETADEFEDPGRFTELEKMHRLLLPCKAGG